MKNLELLKKLYQHSKMFLTMRETHDEHCKQQEVDKHGLGFNKRDECVVFSSTVRLNQWDGTYGSSSVSCRFRADKDIADEAFKSYLAEHEAEILRYMSDYLLAKAVSLKEEAEIELNNAMAKLKEIEL